ncbi:hypothetical protein BHM03_00024475 [Ensete ventricosum]|nr:hypothetical protein BHM03_00024475 [Ensete ventricosum]
MECGSCLHGVVLLGCLVCLLILALGTLFTSADTLLSEDGNKNNQSLLHFCIFCIAVALHGVASNWQNIPSNWAGEDPCGDNWQGVKCSNSHITSMSVPRICFFKMLSNLGISEIDGLQELVHLILVGCRFSGNIQSRTWKAIESIVFVRSASPLKVH